MKLTDDDMCFLNFYHSRITTISDAIIRRLELSEMYPKELAPYSVESLKHDLALIRYHATEAKAVVKHAAGFDGMRRQAFELFGED